MEIIDFFNHEKIELPKMQEIKNKPFLTFLRENFDSYLVLTKQLHDNDFLSKEILKNETNISELSNSIIKIVENYLEGRLYEAYDILNNSLLCVIDFLNSLISNYLTNETIKYLYRLRKGDNFDFQRKDLFHIPFELRNKIKTRRYSIPGIPCLYLGGSVYICWEEMNRPDFNLIHGSAFRLTNKKITNILDFGYRPAHIAAMINSGNYIINNKSAATDFIISQAVLWPLVFSCSIKTKHKDVDFQEEYIIPQLLLQWILNNQIIDGIRYFSTRIKGNYDYLHAFLNYAFPVKTSKNIGYCDKLVSMFELSNPFSWQVAHNFVSYQNQFTPNQNLKITLDNGIELIYINSLIEKYELMLDNDFQKLY